MARSVNAAKTANVVAIANAEQGVIVVQIVALVESL